MPPPGVTAIFLSPRAKTPSLQTCVHTLSTQPLRPRPKQPQNNHQQANRLSNPQINHFTTSNSRQAREQNFYEILDVPVGATPAEIKKQFYALSLRHHPDRNRSDPSASQRFSRISAAYNVLSNTQKRATYDRDNGLHATPSHSHSSASPGHTHAHPMGSHSSGSYAGSRPASGLSKRRNAFHGPPPSFYEQGGYGSTGRRAETYAPGKAGAGAKAGGGFASAAGFDSSVDAEDWAGFINRNPLHHFNARGHFRTQAAEDQRRQERRRRQVRAAIREHAEHESRSGGGSRADDTVVRFLVVSGILVVATGITGLFKWSAATATAADAAHGGKATRRREAYS